MISTSRHADDLLQTTKNDMFSVCCNDNISNGFILDGGR